MYVHIEGMYIYGSWCMCILKGCLYMGAGVCAY